MPLTHIDKIDGHDWYAENAAALIKLQHREGNFEGECGTPAETAFAILFLSRATAKLVGRPEPKLGGGLMIGGRGLPKNLAAVQTTGDGIKVRKIDAPVDKLLSELENPKSVELEAVQQAIVDTVAVGDREKLVGQKERLNDWHATRGPKCGERPSGPSAPARTVQDALVLSEGPRRSGRQCGRRSQCRFVLAQSPPQRVRPLDRSARRHPRKCQRPATSRRIGDLAQPGTQNLARMV